MSLAAALAGRRIESTPVRISGAALVFVAAGMVISAGVALIDGGGGTLALLASAAVTAVVGGAMMGGAAASDRADSPMAFASVAWAWLAMSAAGTLPYLLSGVIGWHEADNALFESISGFTCTGATILADIDGQPHGILFFRSMTQWFGGMGLIVLAVGVLPALKVGGLELIANEAPGPTADRFTPRIAATARRLWMIYGALTAAVALGLVAAGMSLFDAVAHAFTTVATGGYSTHSASIAYFDSVAVELVLFAGMIICAGELLPALAHHHADQIAAAGLFGAALVPRAHRRHGDRADAAEHLADRLRAWPARGSVLCSVAGHQHRLRIGRLHRQRRVGALGAAAAAGPDGGGRHERLDRRRHEGAAPADPDPLRGARGDPGTPSARRAADAHRRHRGGRGGRGAGRWASCCCTWG